MPLRTTAVEVAEAKGWSKADLAKRTGLALSTIYNLADGGRPSAKAISAIIQVFPDLPFERLFVPSNSNRLDTSNSSLSDKEPAAA